MRVSLSQFTRPETQLPRSVIALLHAVQDRKEDTGGRLLLLHVQGCQA